MKDFTDYIKEVNQLYQADNATEHSYRHVLLSLIKTILSKSSSLQIVNEPRRIDCGAPDYIITRANIPVCYIEAKDIGIDLNSKQNKAQFDRYINSLDNLIITDYLTFIFYQKQQRVETIQIAEIRNDKIASIKENFAKFENFINAFAHAEPQSIIKSQKLSQIMANKAKLMAEVIEMILNDTNNPSSFHQEKSAFQKILIKNISNHDFADVYAQTITYGMFAAKLCCHDCQPPNDERSSPLRFDRIEAAKLIPKTNPFLRKLFQNIAVFDLDTRFSWIVDDLAESFRVTDMNAVMGELGNKDPIIHFYEYFLIEYNSTLRKSRGVYYTPQEVVNFIVRAVDDLLINDFDLPMGLADTSQVTPTRHCEERSDKAIQSRFQHSGLLRASSRNDEMGRRHKVQILDPATGTGTFLVETIKQIHHKFSRQQGLWQSYVSDHLLPRLNGFEILMAPYTMAHLNLNWTLEKTGFINENEKRLRVFLTNSLDEFTEGHRGQDRLFSQEADEAGAVKLDTPVMVVLGNPPYSGESQNNSVWIDNLLGHYKKEPSGIKLQEKNSKWLSNDYVKFIRFGQHFIEKKGEGILAYITDNSFLDSLTFRGMRYNLLQTFDTIYILNLHGSSLKNETTPEGSKDENVFDIMQGVSINIFVKSSNGVSPLKNISNQRRDAVATANVFYYDLYGKREDKYTFLLKNDLKSIEWNKLQPQDNNYFLVPKDFSLQDEYNRGFGLQDLFPVKSTGIVSKRDAIAFKDTKTEIIDVISDIYHLSCDAIKKKYNQISWDSRDGKVEYCKNNVMKYGVDDKYFVQANYRPFETKWTFYNGESKGFLGWPVRNIMQHFLNTDNVGLVVGKQCDSDWRYVFISKNIVDINLIASAGKFGCGYIFPLYLKPEKNNDYIQPNLDMSIVREITRRIGMIQFDEKTFSAHSLSDETQSLTPLNILDYIYTRLHSQSYRDKYKEFLKIDFPRVPYPDSAEEFWHYARAGMRLRKLHLMDGVEPDDQIANFNIAGNNSIEKPKYINIDDEQGMVYINDTQYFDNVPLVAWEFYIGGYQPAQKWLKDKKGKTLSYDDIIHYQKIIKVLSETAKIANVIDFNITDHS